MATDPEVRVKFPALPDFLRSDRSTVLIGSGLDQEINVPFTRRE
jgi:hypothetical protein